MKISILVVLYSCEIKESETINTLVSAGGAHAGVRLVIWNNGPQLLKRSIVDVEWLQGFDSVDVIETVENRALSNIYNQFLEKYAADRYVLLDHDSTLNTRYISEVISGLDIQIGVPLIELQGIVRSPVMRGGYRNGPYSIKDEFVAIGSGLVLSAETTHVMSAKFDKVFDERFYLYGVDTVFFFRVWSAGLSSKIMVLSSFDHSLSRLEVETPTVKAFRKIERSYEVGLKARYYFRNSKFEIIKILIKRCLGLETLSMRPIFKAFLSGRHYRNDK